MPDDQPIASTPPIEARGEVYRVNAIKILAQGRTGPVWLTEVKREFDRLVIMHRSDVAAFWDAVDSLEGARDLVPLGVAAIRAETALIGLAELLGDLDESAVAWLREWSLRYDLPGLRSHSTNELVGEVRTAADRVARIREAATAASRALGSPQRGGKSPQRWVGRDPDFDLVMICADTLHRMSGGTARITAQRNGSVAQLAIAIRAYATHGNAGAEDLASKLGPAIKRWRHMRSFDPPAKQ